MICKHSWNDAVKFDNPHAIAICEYCGQVAWAAGHTPKKPVFMAFDGKQIKCSNCIRIIIKTGEGLDSSMKHNHYLTEIKSFQILPMRGPEPAI